MELSDAEKEAHETWKKTGKNPELPDKPDKVTPYIPGGASSGDSKTALDLFLEQHQQLLSAKEKELQANKITSEEYIAALNSQKALLDQIAVGEDERYKKQATGLEIERLITEAKRSALDKQIAMTDVAYAKREITEQQFYEQRKKQLEEEVALYSAGTKEKLEAEKRLYSFINSEEEKVLNRQLSKINGDAGVAQANLKTEEEQKRHEQAMSDINGTKGNEQDRLVQDFNAKKAMLDKEYQIELKASQKRLDLLEAAGDAKKDEYQKELQAQKILQEKHNADSLRLDNNLAEQQAQLRQRNIEEWNRNLSDLITGTRSAHDILKDMWVDFVNQVIAQMFRINAESNIFTSLLGGIFGIGGSAKTPATKTVASGAGGWDIPDMPGDIPMFVHRKEMVLPADLADRIRSGSIGGGSNVNVTIAPTFQSLDPAQGQALFKQQLPMIKNEIVNAIRTEPTMRNAVRGATR